MSQSRSARVLGTISGGIEGSEGMVDSVSRVACKKLDDVLQNKKSRWDKDIPRKNRAK